MNGVLTKYHFSNERIRSETDLIHEAKANPAKFELLYKNYHEQIFLFILKRVESEDIAADITSQVFLKALVNLSKFQSKGLPFGSWLYRIARNEVYDLHRQNKIEMVVSIQRQDIWDMIGQLVETSKEEDYSTLYNALNTLSDAEMELIELRFFEKRQFKEIAEIIDTTENNAKVKTYRILHKLKTFLSNER